MGAVSGATPALALAAASLERPPPAPLLLLLLPAPDAAPLPPCPALAAPLPPPGMTTPFPTGASPLPSPPSPPSLPPRSTPAESRPKAEASVEEIIDTGEGEGADCFSRLLPVGSSSKPHEDGRLRLLDSLGWRRDGRPGAPFDGLGDRCCGLGGRAAVAICDERERRGDGRLPDPCRTRVPPQIRKSKLLLNAPWVLEN